MTSTLWTDCEKILSNEQRTIQGFLRSLKLFFQNLFNNTNYNENNMTIYMVP